MRTVTTVKIYAYFEELEEDRKKAAIEENKHINIEDGWYESSFEDAREVGSLMGLNVAEIYFRGFSSQGDGACFNCTFSHIADIVESIKEYAPLDEQLHSIAARFSEQHAKALHTAHGLTKSRFTRCSMLTTIKHDKGVVKHDEWRELLEDFASWIYKRLESEYDYLISDEAIKNTLIANEKEFEI